MRLVTLTGPGGSGKTRLAIAVAREVVERFPDGVYFVPLAAVTTAEIIWSSIGEALDLPAGGSHPAGLLRARGWDCTRCWCWTTSSRCRAPTRRWPTLLREAPDLVVLATSRRPLHLTSEHQYAVAPLALPAADTLEAAEASPAVQLFVDRARAVRASFALTADNSLGRGRDLPSPRRSAAGHRARRRPVQAARAPRAAGPPGPGARPARSAGRPADPSAGAARHHRLVLPAAPGTAAGAVSPPGRVRGRRGSGRGWPRSAPTEPSSTEIPSTWSPTWSTPAWSRSPRMTTASPGSGCWRPSGRSRSTRSRRPGSSRTRGGLHAAHFAGVAARLRWRAMWDTGQQAIRGRPAVRSGA